MDEIIREKIMGNPNMVVPHYLCAAYTYYELNDNYITDDTWDWMAKFFLTHFDEVEHAHKHLLTRDMLTAGTFLVGEGGDYPSIVKGAAHDLLRTYHGGRRPARKKRVKK